MQSYAIYTVNGSSVTKGATIFTLHLKGAGIDIPAILIGEEGRGRERGAVPVGNPPMVPCPDRNKDVWSSKETCEKCQIPLSEQKENHYRHHPDDGMVQGKLMFAEIGQTKAGKPKFFSKNSANTDEKVIVVLETQIGFRGGNSHTGDRKSEWYTLEYYYQEEAQRAGIPIQEIYTAGEVKEYSPKIMRLKYPDEKNPNWVWNAGFEEHREFEHFPGEILAKGCIAQGAAGRMGSGEQLIAVIPKNVVFRTSYSGRLYSAPSAHYYIWNGEKLLVATWDERCASDIF